MIEVITSGHARNASRSEMFRDYAEAFKFVCDILMAGIESLKIERVQDYAGYEVKDLIDGKIVTVEEAAREYIKASEGASDQSARKGL